MAASPAWMRPLQLAAVGGTALITGLVLVGSLAGIEVLTTFGTDAPMHANVALALLAASCALPLVRGPGFARRVVALTLGLAVVGIGAATILRYLAGVELGIELWVEPGRIGVGTAWLLVVLGVAVVLSATGSRDLHMVSQWLALLVLLSAVLVGVGQGLDVADGELFAVAPHTAVAACFVSGVLSVVHPEVLPARPLVGNDAGGHFGRRLLPLAVIVPISLAVVAIFVARRLALQSSFATLALGGVIALLATGMVVFVAHRIGTLDERRRVTRDAGRVNAVIVEQSPIGVEVWRPDVDADGEVVLRLVASNPAAGILTGVERHGVIGKLLDELPYALFLGPVRDAVTEVARTGVAKDVGAIALPVRGTKNTLAVRAFALPDGSVGITYTALPR